MKAGIVGLGSAVARTVGQRQWVCRLVMKGARADYREVEVIYPLGYNFFYSKFDGVFFFIEYLIYSNLIFFFFKF